MVMPLKIKIHGAKIDYIPSHLQQFYFVFLFISTLRPELLQNKWIELSKIFILILITKQASALMMSKLNISFADERAGREYKQIMYFNAIMIYGPCYAKEASCTSNSSTSTGNNNNNISTRECNKIRTEMQTFFQRGSKTNVNNQHFGLESAHTLNPNVRVARMFHFQFSVCSSLFGLWLLTNDKTHGSIQYKYQFPV